MKKRSQSLTQKAMLALTDGVAKALEEHRKRGIPIAVWQKGRPVSILPTEIAALHEKTVPYRRTKSHGTKH